MVYFKFQWNNEIRRLDVGRKSYLTLTYASIKELAASLFGNSLPKKFAVKYRDDENDLVTISTERELKEALNLIDDKGILKFVIQETSRDFSEFLDGLVSKITSSEPLFEGLFKSKTEEKKNLFLQDSGFSYSFSDVIHPAICDACGLQIRGIRWKCGICADFDLCEICETKPRDAIHPTLHYFLKLTNPDMLSTIHVCEKKVKKSTKKKEKKSKSGSKKKIAKKETLSDPVELPKVENDEEIALFKSSDKKSKSFEGRESLVKSMSAPASPITGPKFEQPLWLSHNPLRTSQRAPEQTIVESVIEHAEENDEIEELIEEQIEETPELEVTLTEETPAGSQIEYQVVEDDKLASELNETPIENYQSPEESQFEEEPVSSQLEKSAEGEAVPLIELEEVEEIPEEITPAVDYSALSSQISSSSSESQMTASQVTESQVAALQEEPAQSQISASQVTESQMTSSQTESQVTESQMTESQLSQSQFETSQMDANKVHVFEVKLSQLADMGFNDRIKNIQCLIKNNGDMLETVKNLLDC